MKGVSKRVIEIVETENEAVERILIFLKPGVKNIKVSQQKADAEKYVSGLVSFRRIPFFKPTRLATFLLCGTAALAALGAVIFII